MKKTDSLIIYTDGACIPNPGPGGWAAIIIDGTEEKILQGSDTETTNNRMELTAAIQALEYIKKPSVVIVHTDSEYLQKGIVEWLPRWLQKNWKGSHKKVANRELWERLIIASKPHKVQWHWLKAHAGNRYNHKVDILAKKAATSGLR